MHPLLPYLQSHMNMHQDYTQLVNGLRATFESGRTQSEEFRRHQLKQLLRLYEENGHRLLDALKEDLGKGKLEASVFEVEYIKEELRSTIFKLSKWINLPKPQKNISYFFDDVQLLREPLGVVLVIGPSNYPIKLVTLPAHGAIAAGNCVVMKPSHLTPNCSALLARLVAKYLDKDCYKVVLADPAETNVLLQQRFDYIFATCSPSTGRIVAEVAARHMTPVTLQMGSKCPVYLDENLTQAEADTAVKRLVFGKMINLGQMCMSPDYVLCTPKARDTLIPLYQKHVLQMYGYYTHRSKDLGRIIDKLNTKRLESLIKFTKGRVVSGGQVDVENRWVSPTLIVDVPLDDVLMQEEIFGPILPVVLVKGANEALELIRSRNEKPMAVYVFSEDKAVQTRFSQSTSSGAVGINDCVYYAGVEDLPFGGVGTSGMGHKYHGVHSFLAFTHEKGCLVRKLDLLSEFTTQSRYPPGSEVKLAICKFWRRSRQPIEWKSAYTAFILAGLLTFSVAMLKLSEVFRDFDHDPMRVSYLEL